MITMHFSIHIQASQQVAWDTMLGSETYKEWVSPFCEGSYYDGSWEKGQEIRFLGPNGDGGMSSVIAENRPFEFISVKHLGIIRNGVEETESEEAKKWVPSFENYTFTPASDGTEIKVQVDVAPEYEKFMSEAWPKALSKLKALCESR